MSVVRGIRLKGVLAVLVTLMLLASGCSKPAATGAAAGAKLEVAVKYLAEAQYDQAVLAYQEVIKIDPRINLAYIGLSTALAMQDKTQDSLQALVDGLKSLPEDAGLQLVLAGAYASRGDKAKAEASYKKSIAGTSVNLTAYRAYSSWLISEGRAGEALELLEKAAADNSRLYALQNLLALANDSAGKNMDAIAAAAAGIDKQPSQVEAYRCMETFYGSNGTRLLAAAEQYLQQGREALGSPLKLSALVKLNRNDEAVQYYLTLSQAVQGQGYNRLLASRAYVKLGQADQGKAVLGSIDINAVADAGLLGELAEWFLENGDMEKARAAAQQGINQDASFLGNYQVLYQSYAKDEPVQAKVWAITYLLKSGLGFSQAMEKLVEAGIILREQDARSQAIRTLIYSPSDIAGFQSHGPNIHSSFFKYGCAYDSYKNKAYVGLLLSPADAGKWSFNGRGTSSDLAWKSIVLVVNNPKLIPLQVVPADYLDERNMPNYRNYCSKYGVQQVLALPYSHDGFNQTRYHAVSLTTSNFAEDLQKAGIPPSGLVFLEI